MSYNPHADFLSEEPVYAKPDHTSPLQLGNPSPNQKGTTLPHADYAAPTRRAAFSQLGLCVGAVFRHFKGDYYVIRSVDYDSEDTSMMRVSYQAIKPPYETWSRPAPEFLSEVPEGRYSPTGQKRRFEIVTDFHQYPLSGVPTELLVSELKKRTDNPYRNEADVSRVLMEDYVVGRVQPALGEGDQDILDVLSSFNTEDGATDWLSRHSQGKRGIVLRRVFFRLASDR